MGPRDISRFAVDAAACAAIGTLFFPGIMAAIGAAGTFLTAGAIVALAIRIHWSIR